MANSLSEHADFIKKFQALTSLTLPVPPEKVALPDAAIWPSRIAGKKCALLLSPHPDDECLTGALPLRLAHEDNWQIINIPVTLGSDAARKQERLQELSNACSLLGFNIALPTPEAFNRISPETRDQSEKLWRGMVERMVEIFQHFKPDAIFMPNIRDGHRTHIGTYYLGMDALNLMPSEFSCLLVQTEYWHPNAAPNTMVGLSAIDATTLLTALCCHAGENARNPFHLRFPAYLSDNVRRGSERVTGAGSNAANFDFAMLYQIDFWQQKRIRAVPDARVFAPESKIILPQ